MGGASSFIALLRICGFLSAAWTASKVSQFFGISSIVLEIGTGIVLGPSVLGLLSQEYASCEHQRYVDCELELSYDDTTTISGQLEVGSVHVDQHVDSSIGSTCKKYRPASINDSNGTDRRLAGGGDFDSYDDCVKKTCKAEVAHSCGLTPDVFTLIGHTGVALMIFESGMHFDFEKGKQVGPKACVVAVFGTFLPLISGAGLMMAFGYEMMAGVAVGTALAPTSVGIALRLLGEAGVLAQDFGQAIITAAFVDDILSLILFNVLFSLQGEFDPINVVVKPLVGIAFMGVAMGLAVSFWPWMINKVIMPHVPKGKTDDPKITHDDEALFAIMMGLLVLYGTITHFLGTHLWGCFIAGMSFACIDLEGHEGHAHHVWVRQTKRITSWMIRIFFACTVAFSIPIEKLLSMKALGYGSAMGIGPCILSKVLSGPFMGDARWVIGWAMVGRAEFAYLIAQMAAAGNMIGEDAFAITIWALLYATIFAPFVFGKVLQNYIAAQSIPQGPSIDIDGDYGRELSETGKDLKSGDSAGNTTTVGKETI
jgi:Kef-type K+ transport system membrane component KefB